MIKCYYYYLLLNKCFFIGKHPRGFERVTYHKECLNSAPIQRQSKALWAYHLIYIILIMLVQIYISKKYQFESMVNFIIHVLYKGTTMVYYTCLHQRYDNVH